MARYDAIVIGIGGMGSAALYHLARRGAKVLGIERFDVPHTRGSSHGKTRIIRKSYFEHPDYVPLLHRAYRLWSDLEADTGQSLFVRCGLLIVGRPDGAILSGVALAAALHKLDLERLDVDELLERFPAFIPGADMEGIFESDAGFLRVEECTKAHAEAAVAAGATLQTGCNVLGWAPDGAGVSVVTDAETHHAAKLVICGGAWAGRLLESLSIPLSVRRKVMLWYAAERADYGVNAGCPAFGFDCGDGFFYGFPAIDDRGVKAAEHTGGETIPSPDHVDRELHPDDQLRVERFLASHLPGVSATLTNHCICLYTMTPDEHFIIDRHPEHPAVSFAAGFSGHGYKFAPIVGSILADFALTGRTAEPADFLRLSRPALATRTHA